MRITNNEFEIMVTSKELALLRSIATDLLPLIHDAGSLCMQDLSDVDHYKLAEIIESINFDLNNDATVDLLRSLKDLV